MKKEFGLLAGSSLMPFQARISFSSGARLPASYWAWSSVIDRLIPGLTSITRALSSSTSYASYPMLVYLQLRLLAGQCRIKGGALKPRNALLVRFGAFCRCFVALAAVFLH